MYSKLVKVELHIELTIRIIEPFHSDSWNAVEDSRMCSIFPTYKIIIASTLDTLPKWIINSTLSTLLWISEIRPKAYIRAS